MTQLVFVLCALRSVLFWSHLEAVLSCFRFKLYLKISTNFHIEPGEPVGQCASVESSSNLVSGICQI